MYTPDMFAMADRAQIHGLMRARPFATIVSMGDDGMIATHLPTVLITAGGRTDCGVIECHMARPNTHWKHFSEPRDALMIFQGMDGYITPNWYPTKAETGKVVPTWNYAAVHAYGRATVMASLEELHAHVDALTNQFEQAYPNPWATSDAPVDYMAVMMRGIVGVRFEISRLEGKQKLSQNRLTPDMQGVINGLKARGQGKDNEMANAVEQMLAARTHSERQPKG